MGTLPEVATAMGSFVSDNPGMLRESIRVHLNLQGIDRDEENARIAEQQRRLEEKNKHLHFYFFFVLILPLVLIVSYN